MCGAPACLTFSPPIAGRKFKAVFGADAQQGRALLNWGRVLMLRAELAAQEPQVPHCCPPDACPVSWQTCRHVASLCPLSKDDCSYVCQSGVEASSAKAPAAGCSLVAATHAVANLHDPLGLTRGCKI